MTNKETPEEKKARIAEEKRLLREALKRMQSLPSYKPKSMTTEEICAMGLTTFRTRDQLKGRVFLRGKLTDCMQVQVMTPSFKRGRFQCGLDLYPENKLVITTVGHKWGHSILDVLEELTELGRLDDGYAIIVCDDPIYEEKPNSPVEDETFLRGIGELLM